MKTLNTIAKTGDKITVPDSELKGEIGTYKNGKIRVLWYINKFSGFSEYLTTRELNRRINENKILINN